MRLVRGISPVVSRRLLIGVYCAGALVSGGCAPDEVQAPQGQAEIEMAEAPTNGLIGEWKLDETGGTTAADTKNGYNAGVLGGAAFVAGKLGNALNLNNGTAGTGGKYAQMPSNATLDNVQEGNYTISAWFHPYSMPPDSPTAVNRFWAIVAKAGQHMGLVYNPAGKFVLRHYLTGNTLVLAQGTTIQPLNSWHHVVGTVNKAAGTAKIYVNGELEGTSTFTVNTPAREYLETPFQIGRADTVWAADGKVDQVRIYNRELSGDEVDSLFVETEGSSFRFPIGMSKGQQLDLLGMPHTPDGHMSGQTVNSITRTLDSARAVGARVTIRATGGNGGFTSGTGVFDIAKWKLAFDNVKTMDMSGYLADGTLIGHYAIDEPFSDFPKNMSSELLEQICQYQKEAPNTGWSDVPCIIREKNTKLHEYAPAGGYQYVDAGWATVVHHSVKPAPYNWNIQAFYDTNLVRGRDVGLGMVYSFNLLNGGNKDIPGCISVDDPGLCAMRAAEVRAMADAIANLGDNQGCGVIGYEIEINPGPKQDYFFSRGEYSNNGIQSALQYLNNSVGGLQPGPCDLDG
jgi:concanavalin A-like lectin/glucanase superfamily protein